MPSPARAENGLAVTLIADADHSIPFAHGQPQCANLAHSGRYPRRVPDDQARSGKNVSGSRVREAREQRQPPLTQDQLAGKVAAFGIVLDRTAIAKIEGGQRCVYDYELAALAAALDVDANWLLGTTARRRR